MIRGGDRDAAAWSRLLRWVVVSLGVGAAVAAFSGCGDDDPEGVRATTRPATYWQGSSSSFCRKDLRAHDARTGLAVQLILGRRSVRAGGALQVRIENLGSVNAVHGRVPELERLDGDEAGQGSADDGKGHVFTADEAIIVPRGVGRCNEVPISPNLPAGRYRVAFEVESQGAGGEEASVAPSGEFLVLPAS